MKTSKLNWLIRGAAVLALFATAVTPIAAEEERSEQVRLNNGKYIQGSIVSFDDKGFTMKLTSNGGKVTFRWSQVHQNEKKRILNLVDPDKDLVLEVKVEGDRIELDNGKILEGKLSGGGSSYKLVNLRNPRGITIDASEIATPTDRYIQKGVMIDARSVMTPAEILTMQVETKSSDKAEDLYYLARLAEHLGLYEEAKTYTDDCLAASPSPTLQKSALSLQGSLEELLRQKALLAAIDEANELAEQDQYPAALKVLDAVLQQAKPEGIVGEKLQDERNLIDNKYTAYVVELWYDEIPVRTREWLKDDENEDATVNEAMSYTRSNLRRDIVAAILTKIPGAEERDVLQRFAARLNKENETLQDMLPRRRRASFKESGWYDVVPGGKLPRGGLEVQQPNANDNQQNNGRNNNNRRNNNSNNRRNNSGRDGLPDSSSDGFNSPVTENESFQEGRRRRPSGNGGQGSGRLPETPEDVKDIIDAARKAAEEAAAAAAAKNQEEQDNGNKRKTYDENDRRMQVKAPVKSLEKYWESMSTGRRVKWLEAFYVRMSRDMRWEEDYWDLRYW